MSALVDELRQKAKGQRNSVGDLWGDWICDKAADELTTLQSRLEAVEAERDAALQWWQEVEALSADWMEETGQAYCYVGIRDYAAVKERVEELQKALEPFARAIEPDDTSLSGWRFGITPKPDDYRRAYSAISPARTEEGKQ